MPQNIHTPGHSVVFLYTWTTIRSQGYKTFFMLNSTKHEILNAHKNKNIKNMAF